jgi:hypothetical protein
MNIKPRRPKPVTRPHGASVLSSDAHINGWLNFKEVGEIYGGSTANVCVAFNRGLRKIAYEILLHMTGTVPTDEAVLILSKNEALCIAISESLSRKNTVEVEA